MASLSRYPKVGGGLRGRNPRSAKVLAESQTPRIVKTKEGRILVKVNNLDDGIGRGHEWTLTLTSDDIAAIIVKLAEDC